VRFQIFKREDKIETSPQGEMTISALQQPFTLLAEYDFDQSVFKSPPLENATSKNVIKMKFPKLTFVDKTYKEGSTPIYTIAAIDARGLTSNYGAQFSVHYDKYRNILKTKLTSKEGAPKTYPNIYVNKDTFQDLIKSSGKDRMRIFFDPEYYKVFKTHDLISTTPGRNAQGSVWSVPFAGQDSVTTSKEADLNFIASSLENFTYKVQIINTDLQQSEVVNIQIVDKTLPPLQIPASEISEDNLSFDFGV